MCFPGQTEAVIPTQLIESASLVVLFVLLRVLQRPAILARPGRLLGCYLIGYGAIRWTIEWWRDTPPLFASGGWTLYQVMSLGLIGIGWVLIGRGILRPRIEIPKHHTSITK